MLFLNFSGDNADSIKTNYQEVAEQHKGDGLIFLLGDLEASQSALQVSKSSFMCTFCNFFTQYFLFYL